jgi:opacity protein-like surface antigen
MVTRIVRTSCAGLALALLIASSAFVAAAHAQPVSVASAGLRAGLSLSPDQFVFGGQMALNVAPHWTVDPSIDLGFGDGESDVGINFDALYHAQMRESDWRPYFGGGLQINTASIDEPPPFTDRSDTNLGLNAVLGFQVPATQNYDWFGELRLGVGDVANLKLMGGLNFRL